MCIVHVLLVKFVIVVVVAVVVVLLLSMPSSLLWLNTRSFIMSCFIGDERSLGVRELCCWELSAVYEIVVRNNPCIIMYLTLFWYWSVLDLTANVYLVTAIYLKCPESVQNNI